MQIIPGILATTEQEYIELVKGLNESMAMEGGWVQLDLMDDKFVDNKSVGVEVIKKHPLNYQIEAQLMVEYPENWIDELVKLKVGRVVFPVEDLSGIDERIKHLRNHNIKVGLSINPETSLEILVPWLDKIDVVLVMSVHPGFGGQDFIPETFEKIKKLRGMDKNVTIEVDGGILPEQAKELFLSGADCLVIGAKRLLEKGIDETLESIWESTTTS